MTDNIVLQTKNLGISFGGLKAADNVNLQIKKNEIYGLIGPNGAGKTTVFNMLTGVYLPTIGTFYLNGEELRGLPQERINTKGYVSKQPKFCTRYFLVHRCFLLF